VGHPLKIYVAKFIPNNHQSYTMSNQLFSNTFLIKEWRDKKIKIKTCRNFGKMTLFGYEVAGRGGAKVGIMCHFLHLTKVQ